ncbi:MAG: amidophosphoribosyltransferase [Bdellovibrionota bacterium]
MCAIVGVADHKEASNLTYLGLHALQHRGQEGAGIVSTDGEQVFAHRRRGLVQDVFGNGTLARLKGSAAIGHNRYSTTGSSNIANLQPLMMKSSLGWVSLAHNGNLVDSEKWTRKLEAEGAIFQTTNDTEVIIHLMARSGEKDLEAALIKALKQVEGAFSIIAMNADKMVAVRDPRGFRPLLMGDLDGSIVFASEDTAFDLIGAKTLREVRPGEMVTISLRNHSAPESSFPFAPKEKAQCVFEYVYFARPDSTIFGNNVHEVRKELGRKLAIEQPAPDAQLVIPVPDSGVPAAIGFAEGAKVPFDMGIIRSHYVGRTFIEPQQSIRDFGVKLKLNPVRSAIQGKNIVVVDDSLVRGTTTRKLVKHLRDAGANKVHIRISSPPITHSCFYGIDTPTRKELIASTHSTDYIREYIGADSLGYLSEQGLMETAASMSGRGFCDACFTGKYPTALV